MAQTFLSFDSETPGIIHDVQYDFYGKRLAVGTSEGKICIFDNSGDEISKKNSEFSAHDDSIWELTWSHPRFGSLIASCGFDRKIIIWKETNNRWDKIYEYSEHKNSVNCVAFANQEFGLILLAGSSDGNISLHEYKNDNWHVVKFHAHSFGVNSVSWAPSKDHLRFVSCGSDNLIKIWRIKENNYGYDIDSIYTESTLDSHEDIVRFVSWRPIKDSNFDVIASGGDDKTALLWIAENKGENAQSDKIEDNPSNWKKYDLKSFDNNIIKITWSLDGESLGVTTQDGVSYIFREMSENEWSLISYTNAENNMESADKDN